MALMLHREPNQVKWVGVRPAHNGEQVVKSAIVQNQTSIIYTVTAGKKLYLCAASFSIYSGTGECALGVRNAADVLQYYIFYADKATDVGAASMDSLTFLPPLEITEGYDVFGYSGSAGQYSNCFIFGWEE